MAHYFGPDVESELDDIWNYTNDQSASEAIADRLVDSFTDTFELLARNPYLGRSREDLQQGLRGFPVGSYVILYRVEGPNVRILHVYHGGRDIPGLLGR